MRRSSADGSGVRASARSRSFRDDEENNRLRRGLTAGAAVGGTGGGSLRVRVAASSCHGAGESADGSVDSLWPGLSSPGWSRPNGKPSLSGAGSRGAGLAAADRWEVSARDGVASPVPGCSAMFFNSRTTVQRASMIMPVHATIAPARIRVLPKLRSSSIPKPTVTRPASNMPIPAINSATIIEIIPRPRPKGSQPPMPRYRHIAHTANQQLQASFPATFHRRARNIILFPVSRKMPSSAPDLYLVWVVAAHQGEITPQFRITWKWNCAIWTPGNEAQSAKRWATGNAGLP